MTSHVVSTNPQVARVCVAARFQCLRLNSRLVWSSERLCVSQRVWWWRTETGGCCEDAAVVSCGLWQRQEVGGRFVPYRKCTLVCQQPPACDTHTRSPPSGHRYSLMTTTHTLEWLLAEVIDYKGRWMDMKWDDGSVTGRTERSLLIPRKDGIVVMGMMQSGEKNWSNWNNYPLNWTGCKS